MRDYMLEDPAADMDEPPICHHCGEFMETETDADFDEDTGRVVYAGSSTSCPNADCPSHSIPPTAPHTNPHTGPAPF